MSEFSGPGPVRPSPSAARRADAVCDRFEAAWRAGERPRLEPFCREVPEAEQPALLRLLVEVDIECRRRCGERPCADEYRNRFPDLDSVWLAGVLAAPIAAAQAAGPAGLTQDEHGRPGAGDPAGLPDSLEGLHVPGYTVIRELGRGGMGVVYLARQADVDRVVALKMLLSGGPGEADLARFRREAQTLGRLQHPNIVAIYEVGEHQGRPFFSLEFCPGGNLAHRLGGAPLPPREAAELVRRLASAVQAAHDADVVHRDLKPANILLAADETPKIGDFGLARKLDEAGTTRTGDVIGTPSYMAPEQAAGQKNVGPAADVYALGAILYECLTARPPFKAATVFDTLMQVVGEEPAAVRQLNPQVPGDLETICGRCLRKEPERRYPSARELADELQRFLAGEPIRARPVSAGEWVWKWARRRPAVAGLSAALALLLPLALAVSLTLWRSAVAEAVRARSAEEGVRKEKGRAEKQWTRAEGLLHARQVRSAQREWQAGNMGVAWEHLNACRWDYRGLEHRYLYTLFHRNQATLRGHTGRVWSVAISADGTRIVSGSADGTLRLWDSGTGQELLVLRGHRAAVRSVAFTPDGRRIVSGSEDGTVKVWHSGTGKELCTCNGSSGAVHCVAVSPVGDRLVSISRNGTIKVWDIVGRPLLTLQGDMATRNNLAISPDGTRIASGNWNGSVKVWDAGTGRLLSVFRGHAGPVSTVAFSPDGRRIVSGSWDRTVKVRDSGTGKELFTLQGHTKEVNSVAISADGSRIVGGSHDATVRVWDSRTGRELLTHKGHTRDVLSVAISGDGNRIVSGSDDATVKVWDGSTAQEVLVVRGHTLPVLGVAVSSDGARIVSGSGDQTVKVWDSFTGGLKLTLQGHSDAVSSVAISSDGARIVSGSADRTVKVWDSRTGRLVRTLRDSGGLVSGVAISPDGARIVSGSHDGTVRVWDGVTGGEPLVFRRYSAPVHCVAIGPDGNRIVSGLADNTVRLWDSGTDHEPLVFSGHTAPVLSVAVSPDGTQVVSGSQDRTVKVWDSDTGRNLLTLGGHTRSVFGVAFSPDGGRIVSAGQDVKIWDGGTGQELLTLEGCATGVQGVAVGADGSRIVCGCADHTVRVWDAGLSQDLLTLEGSSQPLTSVAFGADGTQILARDEQGTILAWDTAGGQFLPDAPALMLPGGRSAGGADEELRVTIDGKVIRVDRADLVRARKQHEERDRALLARLASFDAGRHLEMVREGDDFAAAFHVERLVRGQPWDASAHIEAAHVLARLGRRPEATAHLLHALFLHPRVSLWPSDPAAEQRAERAAENGDWPRAVRCFQVAAHQPGTAVSGLTSLLPAQAAAGDTAGIRETIDELTRRLTTEKDPGTRAMLWQVVPMVAWAKEAAAPLREQARAAVTVRWDALSLQRYGIALYRTGRYTEAEQTLGWAAKLPGGTEEGETWLFQAMTAHRLGKYPEANRLLVRVEEWAARRHYPGWHSRVFWETLLGEARALVRTPPPMPRAAGE
jgi:WD40 repeat protein/Flp pilus assembly protein TadD